MPQLLRRHSLTSLALVSLAFGVPVALAGTQVSPRALDGGALYPGSSITATGPTASTGVVGLAAAPAVTGPSGTTTGTTGATATGGPTPLSAALTMTVPGSVAQIMSDGYAAAPAQAPPAVQQAIWAGNQLIGLPYVYGGGHASFVASGYDCSGTVSYALYGGGLLDSPLDSSAFETWGLPGQGAWITVYTNPQHAFLEVAGIRLDTSTEGDPTGASGPRWRPLLASTTGFVARHPASY